MDVIVLTPARNKWRSICINVCIIFTRRYVSDRDYELYILYIYIRNSGRFAPFFLAIAEGLPPYGVQAGALWAPGDIQLQNPAMVILEP